MDLRIAMVPRPRARAAGVHRRAGAPDDPVTSATAAPAKTRDSATGPAEPPATTGSQRAAPMPDAFRRNARRLAVTGELANIALLVLVLTAAAFMARYSASGIRVHVPAMAAWAFAGALIGVPLGHVRASDRAAIATHRATIGVVLLAFELACMTGLLASAGGIAGPFWLVFLPLVMLTATAVSTEAGVVVGALASGGVYVASLISHTVTAGTVGRLVVVLPLLPAVGYVGSAVGNAARRAAADARAERETLERDLAALQAVLDEVANGDLDVVPSVTPDAHLAATTIAVAFADTVVALRRVVRKIQGGGDELATAATKVVGSAEDLAVGASQQVASVTEVTSTVDQLAATSIQIAETAAAVSRYAAETLRYADEGQIAVDASARAMANIGDKVDRIAARAEILRDRTDRIERNLRVIDEIAAQTNMLAFNAAIEAARADKHGVGFSVVAGEIRKLAERAREATHRVADILAEVRFETDRTRAASAEGAADVLIGAELTGDVVRSLDRITAMVDETAAAAREISVVTEQQRTASGHVVSSMTRVTEVSERYAEASRQAAEAAANLDGVANELRAACGRFKVV